ncbi:Sec-independent protein translocase subunit TatA [Kitasatospora sp. NPDC004745]|uniref:Sec-independent protein translocase subunit TatA n=1 Tax=Kitasatospora sp. NPDC004745 TaxID=3364019 RepID=UPI00367D1242
MLRNALEPWHLLVLVAVVVLLFGSRKLPDMARGLGKSMRILKAETAAMREEEKPAADAAAAGAAPAAAAPVAGAAAGGTAAGGTPAGGTVAGGPGEPARRQP